MNLENLDGYGFHEMVFDSTNPHIIIHYNTQTNDTPTHWHTPMEILMPIENNYTAYVNNREYELKPYDILFVTPNVYHSYKSPASGIRYFVMIDLSVLKDIFGINQIVSLINPALLMTEETFPEIYPRIRELVLGICDAYRTPDTVYYATSASNKGNPDMVINLSESTIYAKLMEILVMIAHTYNNTRNSNAFARNKQQEYLNRFTMICNYIDTHCTENLSLEDISSLANFSKYHFSRLFKEFTGESFYKYVNRKRIEYASTLLSTQNMTVTDIAIASGYSSTSIFIRMFKQFHACTPKEFREKNQVSR
ncbi:MAG: helix-turn-helix transcriptional regulator [Clostridiales bacterium]|nr:helix-turn-helix transcriptional regulator [Candidatus Blautia equi]